MTAKNDWNAEAATMAQYVRDNMFEAHRGAMPWKQEGISVAFGNDGYSKDDRAKSEVARVREYLQERGLPILGFGVDSTEGYSWAMLVQTQAHKKLRKLVWACWMPREPVRDVMATRGVWRGFQPDIAAKAIRGSSPTPRIELN
jgi:hypothetical protein